MLSQACELSAMCAIYKLCICGISRPLYLLSGRCCKLRGQLFKIAYLLKEIPSPAKRLRVTVTSSKTYSERVHLSGSIFAFLNKKVGEHGNVLEGEVISSVYGVRPCVIKFAELSEQNVREAEILTKLGNHTNVIAIIQSGTYCDVFEDHVYLALDKCHNENLRQYLANRKAAGIEFDLNQAIDFAKQTIVGVMYIHDNNIIHLDLKPSNILISQDFRHIKIADFGLSIIVKSPKHKVFLKRQFGTNGYRPIESFGNGEVSQRSDIFSLGTVLLHLLSNGEDVFGRDEHVFIHNVMNDITNTSGLLVSNPKATEHLIKCMVSKERCCRPNIREVQEHPCWSGKEEECTFEYFVDDEVDINFPTKGDSPDTEEPTLPSDVNRDLQFLQRMRNMGFNRKPTIVVLNPHTKYLYRFNHKENTMMKMHALHDGMRLLFTAVSLGEYIYVFMEDQSLYRLEYCDVTATWTRMTDWIGNHGHLPPAVSSTRSIYLIGGYTGIFVGSAKPSRSVSEYNACLDEWASLEDKPTTAYGSALICYKDVLYSFGGRNNTKVKNTVGRMDLTTKKWTQLSDMRRRTYGASAVQCKGTIYILGGTDAASRKNNFVEMYNPQTDQWAEMKPMTKGRFYLRSFAVDGCLFAVGGDEADTIEKYDFDKNQWTAFLKISEFTIRESVEVMMS